MASKTSQHSDSASSERSSSDESARQRIITAARRHFFEFGFRSVTMDDIAAELAMSKKTLYTHFRSKSELLQAVVADKRRSIEADLKQISSESSSGFPSAIEQFLAKMQRHLEEIHPPFMRDIQREAPEIFELVEIYRRDLINRYLSNILIKGRRAGIIRKDIPIRLIIEIWLGVVEAVINPSKLTELRLTPKAGFSAVVSVMLEGLLTAEGRSKP
jgi:AcrR family transcriptional regulator